MSLAKQEFTNAGRSMLGRAQNGETLTITGIVVGEGAALIPADLWPLTVLIDKVMDIIISTKRDYGDGTLLVEGSFRSDIAPRSFYLKEVGIMAHIAAEADRLYSVANVFLDPPDFIDPESPTIQAFKIKLVIDRIPTDNLVVEIGPSENVLGENVGADTVGPGVYKSAAGNILYFKRLVEGASISLTQDEDENSITIAVKQLTTNVDLYVPENHPQAPNPDVAFPNIQAAHDYLLDFRIPSDKIATIHVYKGTFNVLTPILFSHPDSTQITVRGEPRIDKEISQINYIDATHKRLQCASITELALGMRGYVANSAPAWSGGCQITGAVHPLDVPVSIEKRDSRGNYTTTDSASGRRFAVYPTVVVSAVDPTTGDSVFDCPNGIRSIENICAVGGWAAFNMASGKLINCHAWGSTRGLSAGGPVAIQGECVFTKCDFGITGYGVVSGYEAPGLPCAIYVNACLQGIAPSGSGFAIGSITSGMDNTIVFLARNLYGVNANAGASFIGGSIFYAYNDGGFRAIANSIILLGAAYPSVPVNNGLDLYAQGMSYIEYDRWGAAVPTTSPAAETVGNQNAFIHVLNS